MSHDLRVDHDKVYEVDKKGRSTEKGDYAHVIAGLKGSTHNSKNSEAVRERAQAALYDLSAQHDDASTSSTHPKPASASRTSGRKRADSHGKKTAASGPMGAAGAAGVGMKTRSSDHDETVHHHRHIAGLKANLKRSDRSEETKEKIRQQSRDAGEDY
ncbi:hypothetical protein JCM6882_005884 [Rhodosporidiobolus microsporus]